MIRKGDRDDPKGLVFEAYRMAGITEPECRSIFLDWALSLPDGRDAVETITHLLARYGAEHPEHPMTVVLRDGQKRMTKPRRRGGWRSRNRTN